MRADWKGSAHSGRRRRLRGRLASQVNVDPGSLRQAPQPERGPSLSRSRIAPGAGGADTLPRSPPKTLRLKAGARTAVSSPPPPNLPPSRSQRTQTHALKVRGKSPTRAGFLPLSGASPSISMEELSPRERSVGIGRMGPRRVRSCRRFWKRGAARAEGTSLGATFP